MYDTIKNGLDVAGEINGEEGTGEGQVLTGNAGNSNTDGLAIRYNGLALPGRVPPPDVPAEMTPPDQIVLLEGTNLSTC